MMLMLSVINHRFVFEMQSNGTTWSQGVSSQVPPAYRNFSMSRKEKALDHLVKDQWLCLTPEGNVGLGVRSFLDLRSWFRANDVPLYEVCNEAAVKVCVWAETWFCFHTNVFSFWVICNLLLLLFKLKAACSYSSDHLAGQLLFLGALVSIQMRQTSSTSMVLISW